MFKHFSIFLIFLLISSASAQNLISTELVSSQYGKLGDLLGIGDRYYKYTYDDGSWQVSLVEGISLASITVPNTGSEFKYAWRLSRDYHIFELFKDGTLVNYGTFSKTANPITEGLRYAQRYGLNENDIMYINGVIYQIPKITPVMPSDNIEVNVVGAEKKYIEPNTPVNLQGTATYPQVIDTDYKDGKLEQLWGRWILYDNYLYVIKSSNFVPMTGTTYNSITQLVPTQNMYFFATIIVKQSYVFDNTSATWSMNEELVSTNAQQIIVGSAPTPTPTPTPSPSPTPVYTVQPTVQPTYYIPPITPTPTPIVISTPIYTTVPTVQPTYYIPPTAQPTVQPSPLTTTPIQPPITKPIDPLWFLAGAIVILLAVVLYKRK